MFGIIPVEILKESLCELLNEFLGELKEKSLKVGLKKSLEKLLINREIFGKKNLEKLLNTAGNNLMLYKRFFI